VTRARHNDRVPYVAIVGTLGYVLDREANRVLMVHRNARPDDEQYGKYNGLGGKLEADEDVASGMRRELLEEAGIHVEHMVLRGTVSWPGFGKNFEDWLGFIFLVDAWTGEPPPANAEGTLEWVDVGRLRLACDDDPAVRAEAALPMWEGDRWFLPMVFDDDPRPFHGVMPYRGGRPESWSYRR
jgi:8-oxo-dGTP diphosphatase